MDKAYDHKKYEEEIYKKWEESGAFKAKPDGKPYTILMPPPNANASLHAGHAMYTIDDIMIRWKRMQGYSAVWIPGADHAGFETQYVYEKFLAREGKSRMDFDRQTLYQKIEQFVKDNSGLIFKQFRRLGLSADWSRSVFTLDPEVLERVFKTFKQMESEGKVYRDNYMVNYCVHDGTSLSELEVDHTEREDALYYIEYPLADESGEKITVATVRPETMFGDTAVAINPKDKRYKKFIGKSLRLPLTNRIIPIIEDEMVDMEFGTGAVKITPAHDPNDFEAGKKHGLEIIPVIDLKGKMRIPDDCDVKDLEGLKVKEAREKTVDKLAEIGFLDKNKINSHYNHAVTVCYKCGRDLEPMVVPNWFIKVKDLKQPVIEAMKKNSVKFFPARFKLQMNQWLKVMHDWPISRQVVWGIRIPVWYEVDLNQNNIWAGWLDKTGNFQQGYVNDILNNGTPLSEIENGLQRIQVKTGDNQPNYIVSQEKPQNGKEYLPETDTFDTWFSSGQWPLVTLKEDEFIKRLPTDFMGTLSDILPFWVSRMIMFSLYIKNEVPFKQVYLWSKVTDAKGQKMSKSKGNVVNPVDMIDKYGADAVRMSLIYGVAPGSNIPFSEEKIRGMRNFANKIWNIGRFIKIAYEEFGNSVPFFEENSNNINNPDDKKILTDLDLVIKTATASLEKYRFAEAVNSIYEFVWHNFADKYIEAIKDRKNDSNALAVTRHVYLRSMRLLHPFMPFVTEAIWSEIANLRMHPEKQLIVSGWPTGI
jgi:valyl-tRNA synthetase